MNRLRMSEAIFEAIRAHGERTYPHECCGALVGRRGVDGWKVESAAEAVNARANPLEDAARDRYEISPTEIVEITLTARRQGLEIVGFYHSHPDRGAQWSQTDLADAHWIGCSYVITAVRDGKAAETNSFCLEGTSEETKRFVKESIEVQE